MNEPQMRSAEPLDLITKRTTNEPRTTNNHKRSRNHKKNANEFDPRDGRDIQYLKVALIPSEV